MRWLLVVAAVIAASGIWAWISVLPHYPAELIGTWLQRSRQGTSWHYSEMTLLADGKGISRDYVTNEAAFLKKHPKYAPSTCSISWYVQGRDLIVDGDVMLRYRILNGGKTLSLLTFRQQYQRQ